MKKSNKKIPKSYLPKYGVGIQTPDDTQSATGTQNIYNNKRSSGNNIGQYAGYAAAVGQTAGNLAAINEQDYNGDTKAAYQSQAIGDGITQGMGTLSPYIAMGTGIRKSATGMIGDKSGANRTLSNWMAAPHEAASSDIAAANNSENSQSQKIGGYMSAIGDITGMSKMHQMFSYGTGNDEKTTGFWGKYNDLAGISARNNQKNSLEENQFAFGGTNMQPNAEIESEENVVAPNGGFLQADGPTHEKGGVPVTLPGNSMVFSDRLKLGKKTFAKLNKVNNTNKEDKILESNKFGNTSKSTAELMKMAKNKNSEMLFKAQEALKQAKVEAYAKKMGVTLPQAQEASEEGMQFTMGGLKQYGPGGPVDNTKFTPGQRQQAYNDSMTLYKSGFNKAIPNWQKEPGYNDAMLNLYKLNGVTPQSTDKSHLTYDPNYLKAHSVPYAKPVYDPSLDTKKVKPISYPMVNMPMKGLENPSLNFNPQLQKVPANPNPGSSKIEMAPNFSIKKRYDSKGNLVDKEYFDTMNPERQIEVAELRDGGISNPNDKNFDWGSLKTASQDYGNFALQNAGNIYDLTRKQDPLQKYDRAIAKFLDPSAAMRDATEQTRRAEYNVRGASVGNAGTYLANRVGLNAQNIMTKDRIRQQYENANVGIANQTNQFNTEIAYREAEAQAKDRAMRQNVNSQAVHSMASNFGKFSKSSKQDNMDQKELDLFMYRYKNEPGFKEQVDKFRTA